MILSEKEQIVANLPYGAGFKFVDQLIEVDEERVVGIYRFRESEYFYKHHFSHQPITPGVILIECMAQIGLVCLGSFITRKERSQPDFVFTDSQVSFSGVVRPGTVVVVSAIKQYYRFNKLKVAVMMKNEDGHKVAEGWLSGILIKSPSR
ncbi:MAG: acyl carrier protein [Nonlabens sp.]